MVSPSCSARSSSCFVQYIVFLSSERKSSIPFVDAAPGEKSNWTTRRFKAIKTNIRGVIPFSGSNLCSFFRNEKRGNVSK